MLDIIYASRLRRCTVEAPFMFLVDNFLTCIFLSLIEGLKKLRCIRIDEFLLRLFQSFAYVWNGIQVMVFPYFTSAFQTSDVLIVVFLVGAIFISSRE